MGGGQRRSLLEAEWLELRQKGRKFKALPGRVRSCVFLGHSATMGNLTHPAFF